MAVAYLKSAEITVIPAPRECMSRQFNFGAWNEIRLGAFFNFTTSLNDNATPVAETVALASVLDRFVFGIKDNDITNIPGQLNSRFIGVGSGGTSVGINGSNQFGEGFSALRYLTTFDTTIVTNANTSQAMSFNATTPTASTNYNGFYGVKIVVSNRGLSTQAVTITSFTIGSVSGNDYSAANLRSFVTTGNNAGTASTSMAWNNGTIAYPLPDCWYVRCPLLNNRMRFSAIDAILIS